MPVDSLQKQEREPDGQFRKGSSGNPAGRPPGCRNHATTMAEVLLDGEVEAVDPQGGRARHGRRYDGPKALPGAIVPRRKSRAVTVDLPRIERVEDLGNAIGTVLEEAASGRLFLDEAAALIGMMETRRKAIESIDFEKRLQALEADVAADDEVP